MANFFLQLTGSLVEKLVIVKRLSCAFVLVVIEQVVRVEKLHKSSVDKVLHFPHPLAHHCDAKFGPDGFFVSSHHQRKEVSLRNVFNQGLLLNAVDQVVSNDWSFANCIHSCFGREVRLIFVRLDLNAVTACKNVRM